MKTGVCTGMVWCVYMPQVTRGLIGEFAKQKSKIFSLGFIKNNMITCWVYVGILPRVLDLDVR